MEDQVFHLEAWFRGRVQGVGFRYQTLHIAKGFNVTGGVKNLSDGRVWLGIEGKKQEVEAFLKELQSQMDTYIQGTETESRMAPQQFKNFDIVY